MPQGSVFEPVIFNIYIYINDMYRCYGDFKCLYFTDDSTSYVADKNITSLKENVKSNSVNING